MSIMSNTIQRSVKWESSQINASTHLSKPEKQCELVRLSKQSARGQDLMRNGKQEEASSERQVGGAV